MIVGSIVDEMEKDNLFEKEMKEHYVYALTTMIEKWITTIFILAMGVLAKQIVPMILFLIFFFSFRKRTGLSCGFLWTMFLRNDGNLYNYYFYSPDIA